MDTCFLFVRHLNEHGCLCLNIAETGTVNAPLMQRSFAEIRQLQQESKTIIVESTINASLLLLELPWLPERKARIAIPYALEDKVAQSVDELHFAFDKLRYRDNHYLIAVIAKQRMNEIKTVLAEQHISFDLITLDWFALEEHHTCITEELLLINSSEYKGALAGELAALYLKKHPFNHLYSFADSYISSESSDKRTEISYGWIAQRLLATKPLNLCQGEMQHSMRADWLKKGYMLSASLAIIWLISIVLVNAINLHSLNKKNNALDQRIAVIYREFFPEAKQVISPRFRISQLLGDQTVNSQSRFWFLLTQLALVLKENNSTPEQIRYQNNLLTITLISPDFASLERIEEQLKTRQLQVSQTQASTRDEQVFATLELK